MQSKFTVGIFYFETIVILYYLIGSPVVSLTSSVEVDAVYIEEHFRIACSATDGNPNLHHMTLTLNDTLLKVTNGGNFLVYTTKSTYGLFTCTIKSLHSTTTKSLLMQEKGMHLL